MQYFISGHRDLTWEEFTKWYAPAISSAFITDKTAIFIVADYEGADSMSQDYLNELGVLETRVSIYCMGLQPKYKVNPRWRQFTCYTSDIERDTAMTNNSDIDIAFIRKGKEDSGTAQNILRRWTK